MKIWQEQKQSATNYLKFILMLAWKIAAKKPNRRKRNEKFPFARPELHSAIEIQSTRGFSF